MQEKKGGFFKSALFTAFSALLLLSGAQAGQPLITFAPQTPTNITVEKGSSTQIIYHVVNHSSKAKSLHMKPITGVNLAGPCQTQAHGTCTLTLNINGSSLLGDVTGGPTLCHEGSNLQCYQPSQANILRIHQIEAVPLTQYRVTPSAGANGTISPALEQVVNAGSILSFTATPDGSYAVNKWLLDSNVVQNGGTSYQLNNIQADHTVEVTFNQTTLSPATQNLSLSMISNALVPNLVGNARIIRITNSGSIPATNVQVNTTAFPTGTSITANTCTGTLNDGATCDITITPGTTASPLTGAPGVPCTTKHPTITPQPPPAATVVTVSADNAPSTNVNILILGYGCVYQGGYLFAVNDIAPFTGSIGGKVAALQIENNSGATIVDFRYATANSYTGATNLDDGTVNMTTLIGQGIASFPAAQRCDVKNSDGYSDWYLPAIRELMSPGGGANIYTMLYENQEIANYTIPDLKSFWSSTDWTNSIDAYWAYFLTNRSGVYGKTNANLMALCTRKLTP